jgi:hypothetical protein
MVTGLRAQADDPPKSDAKGQKETEQVKVREFRVTQKQDASGNDVEERSIVIAVDPSAPVDRVNEQLRVLIDDPAIGGAADKVARILRIEAAPAGEILTVQADEGQEAEDLGKYWIGVQINDVGPAIKAQLNLEESQGALVGEVLADSPASKADLKQYDIILAINNEKIGRNEDVLKAVKAADGKELKLKILRGGSERSVSITPAERPESQRIVRSSAARSTALSEWIRRVQPEAASGVIAANPNLEFNLVRPGTALALQPQIGISPNAPPELPESLSITVTREGKKPAKISIKQKERDIEITEDKLNELPDDLKRYVAPMLGRPQRAALNLRTSRLAPPQFPGAPPQPAVLPTPVAPPQPGQRAEPGRAPQAGGAIVVPAPAGEEGGRVRVRAIAADPLVGGVERRIQDLERRLEELQRSIRRDDSRDEKK